MSENATKWRLCRLNGIYLALTSDVTHQISLRFACGSAYSSGVYFFFFCDSTKANLRPHETFTCGLVVCRKCHFWHSEASEAVSEMINFCSHTPPARKVIKILWSNYYVFANADEFQKRFIVRVFVRIFLIFSSSSLFSARFLLAARPEWKFE